MKKIYQNKLRRHNIPEKYRGLFYLRDIDLHPESMADYPWRMGVDQCEHYLRAGLLFRSRQEAEEARKFMLEAYKDLQLTQNLFRYQDAPRSLSPS